MKDYYLGESSIIIIRIVEVKDIKKVYFLVVDFNLI